MKILLIGCGKMGSAMLAGWRTSTKFSADVTVVDPLFKSSNVKVYKTLAELPKGYSPNSIVLAVKPQNLEEVITDLSRFSSALFVSIIAGKKIEYFKKFLPKSTIVRTMPNLPAIIGKGITAVISSQKLESYDKNSVENMLSPCGKMVWVNDEALIDSVTAISGSGPAYVFLFALSMIEAASELGLDAKTAEALVFETIKGSIELAERSGDNLATLKKNVTSKGGTTEAALAILEDGDIFKKLIKQAAKQAKQRAVELS